jgi:rfaE bifunctional protein nucleotidyltransferase chain/domain
LSSLRKINTKIQDLESSKKIVQGWNLNKETIVFTNGCFDLLHMGHVDYLSKAKDLGTKLVIGLNSSESVKKLKGPSRPINSARSRASLLAAFECIDLVIIFAEETPINLIKSLKPHVLVKGGDYTLSNIIGAQEVENYGGEVKVIPFIPGYSTTSIITKIESFSKS